jgi:hypothetical protein
MDVGDDNSAHEVADDGVGAQREVEGPQVAVYCHIH